MDKRTKIFKIVFSTLLGIFSISVLLLTLFTIMEVPALFEQVQQYKDIYGNAITQFVITKQFAAIGQVISKAIACLVIASLSALAIAYIWLKGKLKPNTQ